MKRKFLFIVALLLTIICIFNSCNATPSTFIPSTPSDPGLSQADIKAMYEEAKELEESAKFKSAIKLYREVFKHNSLIDKKTIHDKEYDYVIQSVLCYYFKLFVNSIKRDLRDPNSMAIYVINVKYEDSKDKLTIQLDYGAKNGFGGMARKTEYETYTLPSSTQQKIIDAAASYYWTGTNAKDNPMELLFSAQNRVKVSGLYEALLNGTCDY